MTEPLAPGTRIGPFELEEVIGTGSSAIVYRARLVSLFERDDYPERVALKLFTMLDDEQRTAVLNEFQHARRYDSPYVTKVFPPIENGDQVALIYELGEYSLRDRLKDGALSSADLDRLLHDVTHALVALHENHTIHSDVKPANILRFGDGWKLTDLGAATRFTIEADDTVAVLRAYNRPYLSPELTRQLSEAGGGADLTTRRSDDMWALGITLFEAATGVHPFVEVEVRSSTELHDVTIPARLYQSDLPLSVGAVIETCLDHIPERRWVSAIVLCGWLYPHEPKGRLATRAAAASDPGDDSSSTGTTTDAVGAGTTPLTSRRRPRERSLSIRLVIGGLIAVVLFAGLFAAFSGGDDEDTAADTTSATSTEATDGVPETVAPVENASVETAAPAEPAVTEAPAPAATEVPATPAPPQVTEPAPIDPLAPIPVGPAGAAGTITPTYQWNAVPGATNYLIWANEHADPFVAGKIDQLFTPAEVGCPDGVGVCSATPAIEILVGGEWWVTAFLGSDVAHVSPGTAFTTQ